MSRVKLNELAKVLGITTNAVRKAISDGRITAFKKEKNGYIFDLHLAVAEYEMNTNSNLSSNSKLQSDDDFGDDENQGKTSVLDKDPKFWNANEAVQAKTIYSALKVKHELDVQQGKFYEKNQADSEFNRIASTFARGLIAIPSKIKQKIPDLTDDHIQLIKELCQDIASECESKL